MKRELNKKTFNSNDGLMSLINSLDKHVDELNNNYSDITKIINAMRGKALTEGELNELNSLIMTSMENNSFKDKK